MPAARVEHCRRCGMRLPWIQVGSTQHCDKHRVRGTLFMQVPCSTDWYEVGPVGDFTFEPLPHNVPRETIPEMPKGHSKTP